MTVPKTLLCVLPLSDAALRSFRARAALCSLLVMACGCQWMTQRESRSLRHVVQNSHLRIVSDQKLPKSHPLWKDLDQLRQRVQLTLQLPESDRQVVVYLFADEERYQDFLKATYPQLPPRRAYFVGTPRELAVYAFHKDRGPANSHRLLEDLRHEYTHGVLHAALKDVPLWLDEGLAECFERAAEVPATTANGDEVGLAQFQPRYAADLAQQLGDGWRPDLDRLERLATVEQMGQAEYREAWAWTHFMLHGDESARDVLLSYLQDLRTTKHPGLLGSRLRAEIGGLEDRFLAYVSALPQVQLAAYE